MRIQTLRLGKPFVRPKQGTAWYGSLRPRNCTETSGFDASGEDAFAGQPRIRPHFTFSHFATVSSFAFAA